MSEHQHTMEVKSAWPNKVWVVSHRPDGEQTIMIRDGSPQPLHKGEDYSFVGNVITMVAQPTEGVKHFFYYSFSGDYDVAPVSVNITAEFNPNADPETTSVDGSVDRTAVSDTWADIRGGAGNAAVDDADTVLLLLEADVVVDRWFNMSRSILLFDTSSIPDDATILSARLRLYVTTKADTNFSQSVHVVASTPASNIALVAADYTQLAVTNLVTPVTVASLTTSAYNNLALNAAGLAAITKVGITKLGLRLSSDFNNIEPAWVFGGISSVRISTAEGVAAQRPILEVTYQA